MTDRADAPKSPWQGWVNLLLGAGLLIRYGLPAAGLIRVMMTGQISPRGTLIGGCFIALNIVLALMTIVTGLGQIGERAWARGFNAVTGGAVLMNAGYRVVLFGQGYDPNLRTLLLFGPDLLLVAWWVFGLRRGPWGPALIAAAASFGVNYAISGWLSQTRY
jgi:hypothetical protein